MHETPFADARCLFEGIHRLFLNSDQYSDSADLDTILTLADRIYRSSVGTTRIQALGEKLGICADEASQPQALQGIAAASIEELLQENEKWLKLIDSICMLEEANSRKGKTYNHYQALLNLKLISADHLKLHLDKRDSVPDYISRAILIAHEWSNESKHELASDSEPHSLPPPDTNCILESTLIELIAPVYKYFPRLQHELSRLVAKPLAERSSAIANRVQNERERHISKYKGNAEFIDDLKNLVEESTAEGWYILLTGDESSGKSATAAKLSAILRGKLSPLGQPSIDTQKKAPWLPAVIFHHIKCGPKMLEDGLPFLMNQIDTLVTSKLESPDFEAQPPEEPTDVNVEQTINLNPTGLQPEETWERESSVRQTDLHHRKDAFEHYLRIAIHERGQLILIIDAIDEAYADGFELSFLPPHLPHGCCCLLIGRPNSKQVNFAMTHLCNVREEQMRLFPREDVPLLTGLPDETDKEHNDRIYEQSGGRPMWMGGESQPIATHQYANYVDAWRTDEMLKDLMFFLAVFEPSLPCKPLGYSELSGPYK